MPYRLCAGCNEQHKNTCCPSHVHDSYNHDNHVITTRCNNDNNDEYNNDNDNNDDIYRTVVRLTNTPSASESLSVLVASPDALAETKKVNKSDTLQTLCCNSSMETKKSSFTKTAGVVKQRQQTYVKKNAVDDENIEDQIVLCCQEVFGNGSWRRTFVAACFMVVMFGALVGLLLGFAILDQMSVRQGHQMTMSSDHGLYLRSCNKA